MHYKVLNHIQQIVLNNFASVTDSTIFYLTGGTALSAFYLGHRQSHDLDFFTSENEIIIPFSFNLEAKLKNIGCKVTRKRSFNTFIELIVEKENELTLIHLALDSPFRFEPVTEVEEVPGLKIDALIDIASNKLLALFGRATLRDFVDTYFLIRSGRYTKELLMDKAKIKDPGFNIYWLGIAIEKLNIYTEKDADSLLLTEPIDYKEFINFFLDWQKTITRHLKP